MATIGTFKKAGSNEFTGDIITLSVQAKGVRIIPDLRATGENAPSHRVVVGRAEIGAAWSKRSGEGRDYLGLKLDDPSFNAPIYANLFDDEDGEGYSLILFSVIGAFVVGCTAFVRVAGMAGTKPSSGHLART